MAGVDAEEGSAWIPFCLWELAGLCWLAGWVEIVCSMPEAEDGLV